MGPWELLDARAAYEGFRRIEQRRYRLPHGAVAAYDIVLGGATVSIIAVTEADRIVLARQWRPGPEQLLDELPGGAVDADEDPRDAARRELLEETGYAGDLRYVASCPIGAYTTRTTHVFVATSCRRVTEPSPDELEDIEVIEVDVATFRTRLRAGALTDVHAGYLGLDALGLL